MTVWGSWSGPVTNRFRVGIDLSRSGGTVTATYRVECTQAINQSITLNRSGALTGSVSFRMDKGSSGGTTTVGSYTRSINAGQTLTFGASVSGIYNGASPSVSGVSISRPSDAPTTPSAPGTPRIDNVTSTSVTATFEPPASDGGAPIISHQYQISTNSSHTQQVAAPQFTGGRTYTQGGLTPGTQYWIRARVQNSAGWGDWSGSRTFTTSVQAPAAPYNVQASRISDASTRVTWTRNPAVGSPYTSQQVQRRHVQSNGAWSSWLTRANNLSSSATAYTDATIANRRFQYRVRAQNASGWSGFGESGTIDTTPAAPSSVRAVATPFGNRLTWTNESQVPFRTRIERQENGGAFSDVGSLGSERSDWMHESPDLSVTHRYRVRHEAQSDPALASSWTLSNVVVLAAPPSAPTILGPRNAVDADTQVGIPYLHNATDGSEQTARQMRWRYEGDTAWDEQPEEATSSGVYYVPGGFFDNERTVEVQMRTWGMHPDPSPWSATRRFQTSEPPTVAINTPTTDEVVDTSTLDVTWGYAQAGDSAQTAWRLALYRGESLEVSRDGTGTTAHQSVPNLQNYASYRLEVSVKSAAGLWSEPDVVEFTTDFLPPQAPNLDVSWDVDLGAAVLDIYQPPYDPAYAEPDHVQVWRAIDDGPWLLIADQVPLDTAVTDPIPTIGDGTVNYYRAVAVSTLPSTADSAIVPLTVTARMTRGWVYLNAGPGMATVCRVRANTTRSDTEGREYVQRVFAGRTSPVAFSGTFVPLEWDVSARIAPDYDGESTRNELVALQTDYGDQVCYRDALGHGRWFGAMSQLNFSWERITGEVSWSMSRVEFREGLAPTVEVSP